MECNFHLMGFCLFYAFKRDLSHTFLSLSYPVFIPLLLPACFNLSGLDCSNKTSWQISSPFWDVTHSRLSFTDVSGRLIGQIFKGQTDQEEITEAPLTFEAENADRKIQSVPLTTQPVIEDIATKFEQEYVRCVRNEEECVCSVCVCSMPNCCDTEQRSANQW